MLKFPCASLFVLLLSPPAFGKRLVLQDGAAVDPEKDCPYSHLWVCKQMVIAEGEQKQVTRPLPAFQHLVVSDIIKVLSYKVVPGAEPSITFTASESLLETLASEVKASEVKGGTLTVGTGCACIFEKVTLANKWWEPAVVLEKDKITITAEIVNPHWPESLKFKDSASAHFPEMKATKVSSKDAAVLTIDRLDGSSLSVGCRDSARMSVGWAHTGGNASFHASAACRLAVTEGSAKATQVSVRDWARADLGTFTTESTRVNISDGGRFRGQVSTRGDFHARDVSTLDSTVKEGGKASCSHLGKIFLHTPTPEVGMTTDKRDLCQVHLDQKEPSP